MYDLIVVGCGIIGATTVQGARSLGMSVLALDSNEDCRATPASGGHIRLAWLRKCNQEIVKNSMAVLDKIWGLQELQFLLDNDLTDSVFRVDTDLVTSIQKTTAKVVALNDLRSNPRVTYIESGLRKMAVGKTLLVSAGVWCADLLSLPKIQSKAGVSFRVNGGLSEPFIKTWAPYKQIVAHQQTDNEIWIGDGSAILSKNWTAERTQECRERCLAELLPQQPSVIKAIHGWRPYCDHAEDVPCLFDKIGPNAYVATGSKKDGTIASGWVASEILGL